MLEFRAYLQRSDEEIGRHREEALKVDISFQVRAESQDELEVTRDGIECMISTLKKFRIAKTAPEPLKLAALSLEEDAQNRLENINILISQLQSHASRGRQIDTLPKAYPVASSMQSEPRLKGSIIAGSHATPSSAVKASESASSNARPTILDLTPEAAKEEISRLLQRKQEQVVLQELGKKNQEGHTLAQAALKTKPFVAAALVCAIAEPRASEAQTTRRLKAAGVTYTQVIEALDTALLMPGADSKEALYWKSELTRISVKLLDAPSGNGVKKKPPKPDNPESKSVPVTPTSELQDTKKVHARTRPQLADPSAEPVFGLRPLNEVFQKAKLLVGSGVAVQVRSNVFIPDAKQLPHLHVTKDFLVLKKKDGSHLYLVKGEDIFARRVDQARAHVLAEPIQNEGHALQLKVLSFCEGRDWATS